MRSLDLPRFWIDGIPELIMRMRVKSGLKCQGERPHMEDIDFVYSIIFYSWIELQL